MKERSRLSAEPAPNPITTTAASIALDIHAEDFDSQLLSILADIGSLARRYISAIDDERAGIIEVLFSLERCRQSFRDSLRAVTVR